MNRSIFSYGAKWNPDQKTTFSANYNPSHPQEKVLLGFVNKASKRLSLFAELKAGPDNKTDFVGGYRAIFSEGTVQGTFSSSLKAAAVYKRIIDNMF